MFRLQLGAGAADYSKSECIEAMNQIIHGCDGNDPNNPLNWKFGGQRIKGEYTYEVHVARAHRPWPPMTDKGGRCEGWYKGGASYYTIYGHGWATTDYGQKTLNNIKGCVGLGVTEWEFEYFDVPTRMAMNGRCISTHLFGFERDASRITRLSWVLVGSRMDAQEMIFDGFQMYFIR